MKILIQILKVIFSKTESDFPELGKLPNSIKK